MNKTLIYLLLVISLNTIISTDACSTKAGDSEITDIECRKLTVVSSETDLCVLKKGVGCEEKTICEYETDHCSVKVEGYKCTAGEENSCTPSKIICGEEEEGELSEDYCKLLDVEEGKECKFIGGKCTPTSITCGQEEDGKSSEDYCQLLDVEEGKECNYIAGQKCTPTQIICGQQEAGKASPTYCNLLKVDDGNTQACVKDGDKDQCIQASNCRQVTIGATNTICEKLAVTKPGKEKCIVEGNACSIKTICNGAVGTSDNECKDFYVSDSATKKCVKKTDEDICEEKPKSEDEIITPVPSTQNQTSSNTSVSTNNGNSNSTNKDDENGIEGMKISLFIFTLLLIF